MPNRRMIPTTLLALALAACGADQESAAPAPTTISIAPAAARDAAPSSDLQVTPATLAKCDPPSVAMLKWDLSASHPDVTEVEIWVGPEAKPVLFTAMGGKGEIQTGPWATPGAIFRLRDKANGEELARAVIGGPACPSAG